jgi:hypothetical protein
VVPDPPGFLRSARIVAKVLICQICGKPFAQSDDAAVVQLRDGADDGQRWAWVSFLEDWRGGDSDFVHPTCFADVNGVETLVELVHQREVINRQGFWELIDERDQLRKQLNAER